MKTKLLENTVIYTIGNFLTKFIQFLLLPIYTYTLSASELGKFDLYNSIVLVLIPIITLQISDGVFRNLIDESNINQKIKITTNSIFGLFLNIGASLVVLVTVVLVTSRIEFNGELILWMVFLVLNIVFIYFQSLSRGLGKNKIFAFSGFINAIVMGLTALYFLIILDTGYFGLVIATIVSFSVSILFVAIGIQFFKLIDFKKIDFSVYKALLAYSAPLVPNFLSWWIINMSDRLLVNYFLGTSELGIYSIAYRLANILLFATTVFNLAWQESAILSFNSSEKNSYYSQVFNNYFKFLFSSIMILITAFPFIIGLFSESYHEAIFLIPYLLFSVAFSAFSSFFGSAFQSSKNTKEALSSSLIAGITNILLNITLLPLIGLVGAVISTMLSFLIMWIYRVVQTKKYFKISYDFKEISVLIILNIIFFLSYFVDLSVWLKSGMVFVALFIFVYMNKKLFLNILERIMVRKRGIQ
ncbi:oligosaccharide flippase family protein [Rossellomorea marisflavi]|uniref:oligosaccharide flippase family protein n=1 Tax=Rossellomorea marisflavi TaxID=189381 RepID=UPI003D2EE2FA